ncbi:unnamed protein product [Pseudo-nitzschia multistriata]|uniref:Uncharacterized protein n=1 Tax=Pseudo-nitzschia multistriata TaxID=183589 RepID=A0A448Z935_9STRA|nr:unnamed protein product [Pseudo-nitzschia multistriata]
MVCSPRSANAETVGRSRFVSPGLFWFALFCSKVQLLAILDLSRQLQRPLDALAELVVAVVLATSLVLNPDRPLKGQDRLGNKLHPDVVFLQNVPQDHLAVAAPLLSHILLDRVVAVLQHLWLAGVTAEDIGVGVRVRGDHGLQIEIVEPQGVVPHNQDVVVDRWCCLPATVVGPIRRRFLRLLQAFLVRQELVLPQRFQCQKQANNVFVSVPVPLQRRRTIVLHREKFEKVEIGVARSELLLEGRLDRIQHGVVLDGILQQPQGTDPRRGRGPVHGFEHFVAGGFDKVFVELALAVALGVALCLPRKARYVVKERVAARQVPHVPEVLPKGRPRLQREDRKVVDAHLFPSARGLSPPARYALRKGVKEEPVRRSGHQDRQRQIPGPLLIGVRIRLGRSGPCRFDRFYLFDPEVVFVTAASVVGTVQKDLVQNDQGHRDCQQRPAAPLDRKDAFVVHFGASESLPRHRPSARRFPGPRPQGHLVVAPLAAQGVPVRDFFCFCCCRFGTRVSVCVFVCLRVRHDPHHHRFFLSGVVGFCCCCCFYWNQTVILWINQLTEMEKPIKLLSMML